MYLTHAASLQHIKLQSHVLHVSPAVAGFCRLRKASPEEHSSFFPKVFSKTKGSNVLLLLKLFSCAVLASLGMLIPKIKISTPVQLHQSKSVFFLVLSETYRIN